MKRDSIEADVFEIQRWPLLFPVFISLGLHHYFSLQSEPLSALVFNCCMGILLFTGTCLSLCHKISAYNLSAWQNQIITWSSLFCKLLICFVIGFGAAKLRTVCVSVPSLSYSGTATFTGVIESIEDIPRGTLNRSRIVRRLILSHLSGGPFDVPSHASHSPDKDIPQKEPLNSLRVRIQGPFSKLKDLHLLQKITLTAQLYPPPPPLIKDGYDAPFEAFFKQITLFGNLKDLHEGFLSEQDLKEKSWIQRCLLSIDILRFKIKEKLSKHLSGQVLPLATALILGDKSGITLKTRENFTKAGLSHLLAISGLHMGLLSLIIFFLVTKLLALIPPLANRFTIKKIAAILTIPCSFFYLLLSGMSFSALRSFIMFSIAMMAILIDRNPISLRCVACSACVILLLFPESLYSISFQLSFASVTGLCYFYENKRGKISKQTEKAETAEKPEPYKKKDKPVVGILIWCGDFLFKNIFPIVLSTCIATLATAPLIIRTFQRFTWEGLIGNIVAIPLVTFIVMPLAILTGLSLLGSGLSFVFITNLFQTSLDLLLKIAEKVALLPGSNYLISKPSSFSFLLILFGVLWFIIWKHAKRWFGLPCLITGLFLFFKTPSPSLFLTPDVMGLNDGKVFWISNQKDGSFSAKVWSSMCGLSKIEEMSYKNRQIFMQLFAQEQSHLHNSEALFLWISKKELKKFLQALTDDSVHLSLPPISYRQEKLSFLHKKRPWYKNTFPKDEKEP